MVNSKLRRHKVMEKVIKKLFGNNLPPRFKFKDTYASIEVPQAYQQHMPTQQQIEAEFDEMIIKEEEAPTVVVPTEDLKIIAANLYSNVTTSNIGIGTVAPGYTLDVVGDINISGNLYQNSNIFTSGGGGSGSTLWQESNIALTTDGTLTLVFDDQAPDTPFTGTLGGNKVPTTAVRDTTNRYIVLTYNTNSIIGTVYWETTLTSSWEADFEIKAIDKTYGGADDMRFIFFSENPMSSVDYGLEAPFIRYEYYGSDLVELYEPSSDGTDTIIKSASWNMPMNQWLPVKITYNDGVFTSVIKNSSGSVLNTTTHNFGTKFNSLHDVPTYVGITGRSGGVIAEDYVRNITIKATNVADEIYVQKLTTSNQVGIGKTNPVYNLDVVGDINFTGKLYENGVEFGGGSTAVSQGSGSSLYLLNTPVIDEWSWSGATANTLRITYPTSEIPANCKAVLAEVFMPKTNVRDHVGHSLGKNYSETTVWTSNYQQPSSRFTLNRQTTFLDMRGDSDGYDYYYGKWFSSVIIPLDTNNTVYHVVQGESSGTVGWVYVVTRGYYI